MRDHPTTFRSEPADTSTSIEWHDQAAIHRKADHGVLNGSRAAHRGTFAEMIAIIRNMPVSDRTEFVIEKAGDRRYELEEIDDLAGRADFPG